MSYPVRKNLISPVKDKSLQPVLSNGARKFSLVNLGCPKNLVDSDNLAEKLISSGLSRIDNPENTDLLLINTCGFIEDAKKESIAEILKLAAIKKGSRGQGVSPQASRRGDKVSREKIIHSLEPLNPLCLKPAIS